MKSIISLLIMATSAAFADDIKLADGTVLKNATITSSDAASVTITHDAGIARVMIPNLPPELSAKFQYDPERAKQVIRQERQSVEAFNAAGTAAATAQAAAESAEKSRVHLVGTVQSRIDQGLLVDCEAQPAPPIPADRLSRIGVFVGGVPQPRAETQSTELPRVYGQFILKNHPKEKELATDDKIDIIAYPAETVAKYTVNGGAVIPEAHHVYSVTPPISR